MFAILLTKENFPKILEDSRDLFTGSDIQYLESCLDKRRYLITGYVTNRGAYHSWFIMFHGMFHKLFEFDEEKIQTDWDQIVRK